MAYGVRQRLSKVNIKLLMLGADGTVYDKTISSGPTNTSPKIGYWQFINPLPVKGQRFRPGYFKVNPVTIAKWSGTSQSGVISIPAGKAVGLEGYLWTGDIAASIFGSHCPQYYPLTGLTDGLAANRCITRAYAGMNAPSSDIGMLFAEANETLSMLFNPLKGARNLIKKMVKGSPKTNFMKHAADQWLEYRYGIMPAVLDAQMLRNRFNNQAHFDATKLFRSSAREDSYPTVTTTPFSGQYNPNLAVKGAVDKTVQMKTVATLYYKRSSNPYNDIGISYWDIPNLVWEKIPFSFCVDWVFNIGDWLRSHVTNPNCSPLGTCLSFKNITVWRAMITHAWHTWFPNEYVSVKSEYTEVYETLERALNTSAPTFPSVNKEIANLNRTLDSLSLLWRPAEQALTKFRR